MDMDTLGYFIYMDETEHRQKQEREEALRDIFGNEEENEEDES